MPISPESLENFRRGAPQDSFLGVVIYDGAANNHTVHLALARRLDGTNIPEDRWSTVGGERRNPLPGAGGHAQLVNWAGGQAQQIAPGQAAGNAIGFSMIKTANNAFVISTFRSGFNSQHDGARPAFARETPNEARTLTEADIMGLLSELTRGVMGGGARRHSI